MNRAVDSAAVPGSPPPDGQPAAAWPALAPGRRLQWLIGVSALSLIALLATLIFGPELFEPRLVQPSAYSASAIGHRAFADLLTELGFRVHISRDGSARKATEGSLLVLAEPKGPFSRRQLLHDEVLLVLPKRRASPRARRPSWADHVSDVDTGEIEAILESVLPSLEAQVVRPTAANDAFEWTVRHFASTPHIRDLQLVASPHLEPLLATERGILIGQLSWASRRVTICADPDLIANHGLAAGDGANARLAVELVEQLAGAGGLVLFDEECHGLATGNGFYRQLFRFPILLLTIQGFVLFLALAWAASVRERPPRGEQEAPPAGHRLLIENIARLLRAGGHYGDALRDYYALTTRAVLARSHAGGATSGDEELARLATLEESRGVTRSIATLRAAVERAAGDRKNSARAVQLARDLHDWKREMLDGAQRDPGAL